MYWYLPLTLSGMSGRGIASADDAVVVARDFGGRIVRILAWQLDAAVVEGTCSYLRLNRLSPTAPP